MRQFLRSVISSSEKAASLARACRKESDLFQLLVEEKKGDDKNKNTSHDFKTLADVLIQETVRHELGEKYPDLKENILGEESNKFTNTLGESVQVRVCKSQEETSQLLSKVLDGRQGAADILAKLVHSEIMPGDKNIEIDLEKVPDDSQLDVSDFGIWIDPIDGTNNYIRGNDEIDALNVKTVEVVAKGLPVVTVLIGVFNKKTGAPIAGVVNQPFAFFDEAAKKWRGKIHWGCIWNRENFSNIAALPTRPTPKAVLSLTESPELVEKLKGAYETVEAGGAGHKILCVVLGLVDVYVTSKASTYKWDTCAGQGLLLSLGGGCVEFCNPDKPLVYNCPISDREGIGKWCNDQGMIAFRHESELDRIKRLLY